MDVGHLFEDFGLVQAKFDTSKLDGSSLEDKATNDAIEFGAEEIEVVDNHQGVVNVNNLYNYFPIQILIPNFLSFYVVQLF